VEEIQAAAKEIRVFKSANMSLGVNVLLSLVQQAAKVLGDSCDIEIVEKHHNRKLDAPSGTAIMIADAASSALAEQPEYVYERHSRRQPREKREIGISAVRGGTIVGEHEVIFAGTDEVLEIKHTAYSREIFANGAVRAAAFLASRREPGLYNMEHLVAEVL
jgi:4-hydroxy-tetrahydrodipicolinate reductase